MFRPDDVPHRHSAKPDAIRGTPSRFRGREAARAYPEGVALTERDRTILDFEARWGRHGAAKEEAVRTELSLTPARYYQLLSRLVDDADALAHAPMLVHRLRRMRVAREQSASLASGADR